MARDLALQYNYTPGTLGGALGALGGGGGGGNMWGGGGNLYQQADYQMGDNQDLQEISVVSRSGFEKMFPIFIFFIVYCFLIYLFISIFIFIYLFITYICFF